MRKKTTTVASDASKKGTVKKDKVDKPEALRVLGSAVAQSGIEPIVLDSNPLNGKLSHPEKTQPTDKQPQALELGRSSQSLAAGGALEESLSGGVPTDETGGLTHLNSLYSQRGSVEVTQSGHGGMKDKLTKSRLMTYVARIHTLRIFEIRLLVWEYAQLVVDQNMGPRAAQVVVWRRSMLEIASVFYFINLVYSAVSVARSALGDYQEFGDGRIFGMDMGDYATHFSGYVVAEYLFRSFSLAGHFCGFLCVVLAMIRWRQWDRSVQMTALGYGAGYVTPFVLLLVIPFHVGIDMRGIQQQFCTDILDGSPMANMSGTWAPARLMRSFSRSNIPGTGRMGTLDGSASKGLRLILLAKNITLPSTEEFCSFEPKTWEPYIQSLLNDVGKLDEAGSCRAINLTAGIPVPRSNLPDLTQDAAAAIAVCEQAPCNACGSASCLTLLPTLQLSVAAAMASAQTQALSGNTPAPTTPEAALALLGLDDALGSTGAGACNKCVGILDGAAVSVSTGEVPSCASLCLPLWAAGKASYSGSSSLSDEALKRLSLAYNRTQQAADFAMAAGRSARALQVCVDPRHISALQALANLVAATRPLQTLLGLRLAVRALGTLLPMNFAMMLGAFKGACIAKSIVPYSRIPGVILIFAVCFSLPHLTTMMILVKSIIGDTFMLLAVLCFLAANMVYLPFGSVVKSLPIIHRFIKIDNGLLDPDTHAEAAQKVEKRQRAALVFNVLLLVFLFLWIFVSTSIKDFLEMGLTEVDFSKLRAEVFTVDFAKLIFTSGINIFTGMYGLTKISMIFMCDACLYCILLVDEGDVDPKDDPFRKEHGEKERALMLELQVGLDPPEAQTRRMRSQIHEELDLRFPRIVRMLAAISSCCRCCSKKGDDLTTMLDTE